jgi:hypothetical protein
MPSQEQIRLSTLARVAPMAMLPLRGQRHTSIRCFVGCPTKSGASLPCKRHRLRSRTFLVNLALLKLRPSAFAGDIIAGSVAEDWACVTRNTIRKSPDWSGPFPMSVWL